MKDIAYKAEPDPGFVLGKATVRAASLLGLTAASLAQITGLSEESISHVQNGYQRIEPGTKEGEPSALLVRVCLSLEVMVGNNESLRVAWLTGYNQDLGGVPHEMMRTIEGLIKVLNYLEGMRAKV